MASKWWLLAIVLVTIAVVGSSLATPVIPIQKTHQSHLTLNCLEYPPPETSCGGTLTYRAIDLLSITDYLVGYGGRIVNGTYSFG